MKRNYNKGDKFTLSDDALENYGEKYRGQEFTISQWFDHACSRPWGNPNEEHGHPGFDSCAGSALYEAAGLNFALYEWEMEPA